MYSRDLGKRFAEWDQFFVKIAPRYYGRTQANCEYINKKIERGEKMLVREVLSLVPGLQNIIVMTLYTETKLFEGSKQSLDKNFPALSKRIMGLECKGVFAGTYGALYIIIGGL